MSPRQVLADSSTEMGGLTCARAARMHSSASAFATTSLGPRMDPEVSTHRRIGPRSAVGRISRRSGTICVLNSLQPSLSYVCRAFSATCNVTSFRKGHSRQTSSRDRGHSMISVRRY